MMLEETRVKKAATRGPWPWPCYGAIVTVRGPDKSEYRGYMAGYEAIPVEDGFPARATHLTGRACVIPLDEPILMSDAMELLKHDDTLPERFLVPQTHMLVKGEGERSGSSHAQIALRRFIDAHKAKLRHTARPRPSKPAVHKIGTVSPGARVDVTGISGDGQWLVISYAPPDERKRRQVHVQHNNTGELRTVLQSRCVYQGPAFPAAGMES